MPWLYWEAAGLGHIVLPLVKTKVPIPFLTPCRGLQQLTAHSVDVLLLWAEHRPLFVRHKHCFSVLLLIWPQCLWNGCYKIKAPEGYSLLTAVGGDLWCRGQITRQKNLTRIIKHGRKITVQRDRHFLVWCLQLMIRSCFGRGALFGYVMRLCSRIFKWDLSHDMPDAKLYFWTKNHRK